MTLTSCSCIFGKIIRLVREHNVVDVYSVQGKSSRGLWCLPLPIQRPKLLCWWIWIPKLNVRGLEKGLWPRWQGFRDVPRGRLWSLWLSHWGHWNLLLDGCLLNVFQVGLSKKPTCESKVICLLCPDVKHMSSPVLSSPDVFSKGFKWQLGKANFVN
jgi:hypothetical protein